MQFVCKDQFWLYVLRVLKAVEASIMLLDDTDLL